MARTYRNRYFSPLDRRIRTLEADVIYSSKANNRIRSRIHADDDLRHAWVIFINPFRLRRDMANAELDAMIEQVADFRKDYDKLMDAVQYLSVMKGSMHEDDAIARLKAVYEANQVKWGG